MWIDEAATAGFAALAWADLFGPISRAETNPPAYYVLIKLWTSVAGSGDAMLRLPSAFAGLGTVLVLALYARRTFGPRAALIAAAIATSSGWLLLFARQARAYAPVLLLFAIGLYVAHRLAEAMARGVRASAGWAAALALLAAGLMHLHYAMATPAAALFAYVVTARIAIGGMRMRDLAIVAVTGAAALLIAAPSLWLAFNLAADPTNAASWIETRGRLVSFLTFPEVLVLPLMAGIHLPNEIRIALGLVAAIACYLPLRVVLTSLRHRPANIGCLGLIGFGIAGFLLTDRLHPIVLPRTIVPLLLPMTVLLAAGAATLRPSLLRRAVLAALLLPQMIGAAIVLTRPFEQEDWPRVAEGLRAAMADGAGTVLVLGAFEAVALERYLPAGDPARPVFVVAPEVGRSVQVLATRLMTGAHSVLAAGLGETVCAPRGTGAESWMVYRWGPWQPTFLSTVAAGLRAGGGQIEEERRDGILHLVRWTLPRCPG